MFIISPSYAQQGSFEEGPRFEAAQVGEKTVVLLPANWTASASDAELTLTSSAKVEEVLGSDEWNVTAHDNNAVTFVMVGKAGNNTSSKFIIRTNSTNPSYSYKLVLNGTEYEGNIQPRALVKTSRHFAMWT
ncbi:MAG: hypothetical protein HRF40_14695, partial [Nitrososphaera sp.]